MDDNYYERLESMLRELLNSLSFNMSPAEQSEVGNFLEVNEYGLALETLSGILTEEHKVIDTTVKEKVQELQSIMGMESRIIDEFLKTPTGGD